MGLEANVGLQWGLMGVNGAGSQHGPIIRGVNREGGNGAGSQCGPIRVEGSVMGLAANVAL